MAEKIEGRVKKVLNEAEALKRFLAQQGHNRQVVMVENIIRSRKFAYHENSKINKLYREQFAKLQQVLDIADAAPELNMANYDEDQVSELNEAMIQIYKILNPMPGKPDEK